MFVYNLYNGWLLDVSNLAIASHIFNPYCCISIRYHSYIMSAHLGGSGVRIFCLLSVMKICQGSSARLVILTTLGKQRHYKCPLFGHKATLIYIRENPKDLSLSVASEVASAFFATRD